MAKLNNILQENILLKRKISQYQQVLGILPYVDDSIFKGGFRVVGTLEDRNKIECCYRKHGMIVIVVGTDHSYKQYRLISNNCTNSWEEVVYQFDADETKVDLVEDYSEIGGPNLETQRDLNLALKAYVLALQQQIDNIDVEVDDNEVHITEDTSQASIGDTQRDFNRNVASTVDANTNSIGALNNTKVNKTNLTVSGPDSIFKYVYIFNENSDPRRMLAGDLGKNIANSNLTSVAGAGMTLGSSYTWNVAGQFFYMTNLPNKSSDATFNRVIMQDSNSQISYTNGKNLFLSTPSLLTDADKSAWRNGMRLSNEIYSIGQPRIDSVVLPFIDNSYTYVQYVSLIGLNLFVDNQTPTANLKMKRVKDINGNAITPEIYDITNFNVLQSNPNILNFGLNWSTYPQGYYQFFCTHNLLTNIASPELLVKQGITFTNLNPVWQDLTGAAGVDGNNNIVLYGQGDARTQVLIDTAQMQNGFVVKCAVSTSVVNNGANFPGPTRFTMKGDDGLEYGVTLTYNLDFYPNNVGGFTTNVDVIYISYYNGLLTITAEVNGRSKVFSVTSIPTIPRYFYAARAGAGVGSFSARPTQLLIF